MRKKKRSSITAKIFAMSFFIIFVNLVINIMISSFFVKDFYMETTKTELEKIYSDIMRFDVNSIEVKNLGRDAYKNNNDIIIYDKNGALIYSNPSNHNIPEYLDDKSLSNFRVFLEESKEYDIYVDNPIIQKTLNVEAQITLMANYNDDGIIIIQTSIAEVLASASLANNYAFMSYMISSIVTILPCLIISFEILKPIKNISEVTTRIKNGELDARCLIITKDEIGALANNINDMADSLKKYTYELESNNKQLLSDIDEKIKAENIQKHFISDMSHEIKTPISIISGYAQGLKEGIAETDIQKEEYYDIIIDECNRIANLVLKLSTLAKLESSKISLNIEEININTFATQILEKFSRIFCEKNIEIKIITDNRDDYFVYIDKDETERILINFIQNAIKYGEYPGEIIINLKAINDNIYLGVYNTGKNIDENEINKIWDRFYKLDKSHSKLNEEDNSSGLGLSIVKAIMNLYGMNYGCVNKHGGVEFFICLKTTYNQ